MYGKYDLRKRRLILELDPEKEKLEAPASDNGTRRHYLLCKECDAVMMVPWDANSAWCETCQEMD